MGNIGQKHSMQYLAKTASDELHEVSTGFKPAALGFWTKEECIKANVCARFLQPVYGRYYQVAIANDNARLERLVAAYYYPISRAADIEMGLSLGYSYSAITWYVSRMKYKKYKRPGKLKHFFLKTKATREKMGWAALVMVFICLIIRDKTVIHTLKKEKIL